MEVVENFPQLKLQLADLSKHVMPAPQDDPDGRQSSKLSSSIAEALRFGTNSLVNESLQVHIFDIFKERHRGFLGGCNFQKCNMILEQIKDASLWQVTIVKEGFDVNTVPDDVFILENVEQILLGLDSKMTNTMDDGRFGKIRMFSRVNTMARNPVPEI